jgi:hypothetical protein
MRYASSQPLRSIPPTFRPIILEVSQVIHSDHSYKRCITFISNHVAVPPSTGFEVVLHLNGTQHQYLITSAEKLKYFLEWAEHDDLSPFFRRAVKLINGVYGDDKWKNSEVEILKKLKETREKIWRVGEEE